MFNLALDENWERNLVVTSDQKESGKGMLQLNMTEC